MTAPLNPSPSTAASLVAGTALGGQDQLAAWPGLARLVALLHQTAVDDPALHAALAAVAAEPEDPGRIAALAYAVDALASRDTGLQAELARLVGEARQHPTAGALVTRIAGHARVGKLVTIGRAGDIHVHLPPPPAPTVLDQLPPTRVGPVVANLPPRNPNFTGRADLLNQLHQRLHPGQPAAVVQVQGQTLHGLGGVGKTQLALGYAHRYQADYDLIWWVTAEPPAAIPGQLVALARRLGLPEHPEQAETIGALWEALRQRDRWLLIFDNADDPADLRPWWPPESGHVLVTSRNPSWAGLAATVPIDVLPRAEAVAFLQHRLGRDDPALDRLAAALGDLPLALEQAAAYLEETATPTIDYLSLLRTHAKELFALGHPATTEQTIATTWTVSLQRLRQQMAAAEDLLALCAFLASDDISRSLPPQYPEVLPERLGVTVRAPLAYQQAIGALRRYSLITTSRDGQALSLHRLVQAVTRQQLDEDQERQWATAALSLVRAAFPIEPTDPAAWPACARLLPHALAATGHAEALGVDPETTARLLDSAGRHLWQRGNYRQAQALVERALALNEACLGSDHPQTATTLRHLAGTLSAQGELQRASSLYERALSICEAGLRPDHPDTAAILGNLAGVRHMQGDLDAAYALYERAINIHAARPDSEQSEAAWSRTHLAGVLHAQGDLQRARTILEQTVAIYEAGLGPDHPDTAHAVDHLASVLHEQGDLRRARALHERALAIREGRLGPNHPLTAESLNHLANVLADQGDLDGARTLHERALRIRETRLGADHPDTMRSREQLAAVVTELKNRQ